MINDCDQLQSNMIGLEISFSVHSQKTILRTKNYICEWTETAVLLMSFLLFILVLFGSVNGLSLQPAISICSFSGGDGENKNKKSKSLGSYSSGSAALLTSFLRSVVRDDNNENNNNRTFSSPRLFATFPLDSKPLSIILHKTGSFKGYRRFGAAESDGWIYGNFTNWPNISSEDLVYIYPDYHSGLRGSFEDGKLIHGHPIHITGLRCNEGLLEPSFSGKDMNHVYKYENVGDKATQFPKLVDSLEKRNVFVAQSTLGAQIGEGLFAKRFLGKGELISYYAGNKVYDYSTIMFSNMSLDERESRHKNLLTFNDDFDLDVPNSDLISYRATLAHKCNHKFKGFGANADFCFAKHPRFGEIRCIRAIVDIGRRQEIFVDYNYDLESKLVPRWYRKIYNETFDEP